MDSQNRRTLIAEAGDLIRFLTAKEQRVLEMRYMVEPGMNAKELGIEFGVTASAIRKIEAMAIRKLVMLNGQLADVRKVL